MKKITLEPFNLIGIAIRTSNKNGQAARDLAGLWERFWQEDIAGKVPDRISNDIYSVYTEYDGDFTQPYTTLIGLKTATLEHIPDGMKGIIVEGGEYLVSTAKGKLADGIVVREWEKVWKSDLPRSYKTDFEVYGAGAADPDHAEVDIFVGVK